MPRRARSTALLAGATLALAACGHGAPSPPRDFAAYPAIVEIPQPATLYAVSDVHGGYARLMTLLAGAGVLEAVPPSPAEARWGAGSAALVVVGDLIDKGPQGLEVVDALRALEADAKTKGGAVVVLLGNHEAELFADPENDKADGHDGIDVELRRDGLDPASFATRDPRGQWLAERPFAAKIGAWFFAHAGDTSGRGVDALAHAIGEGFAANGWADDAITGSGSLLESRDWYAPDASIGARNAAAIGPRHIVFGHDPHALGPDGAIARTADGALFRIDCGMSPDVGYSTGRLLRVTRQGGVDVAEEVSADGAVKPLWSGPAE